jgi:hypothetical protein
MGTMPNQKLPPLTVRVPEIYVLWHPAHVVGLTLANRIYGWLRPGNGFGPDVFFRSSAAPGTEPGGLPLPLPGEVRPGTGQIETPSQSVAPVNLQIVVLLLESNLVADPMWRYWLSSLAKSATTPLRLFLPVALDSTAFNLPRPLAELNFLRPSGLPLCDAANPQFESKLEAVVRSLLKQLTESLCRLMLAPTLAANPNPAADAPDNKITLFLSHAKIDGSVPARLLRDYIYSQTQLAAFYDENDIPFGSAFAQVLQSSVSASRTAALIAIQSARYASRPWCRRELSLFRTPIAEQNSASGAEHWRLNPMVVVSALEGGKMTAGIPEVGNATHFGWSANVPDQEEQIVTLLLRDVFLAAYHSALGHSIATTANQIVINWLPDPTTLLSIPRIRDASSPLDVFYPGRGLSGLEIDILDEYFPNVFFRSFDQASRGIATQSVKLRSRTGPIKFVGLSISYEPDNLLARGLGYEHLRELLLRIARPILRGSTGLAFGGHWRKTSENFTYELLRLISAEQEDNSVGGPDTQLSIARLYNHLAWPRYRDVTPATEAEWINCCRIIRVSQELAGIQPPSVVADVNNPAQKDQKILNTAITLSKMREYAVTGMSVLIPGTGIAESVLPLSARILLGGKTCGFSGFAPGLFEEALLSLERKAPLYILGGFGGAAEVLANACLSQSSPPEFQITWLESTTPNLKDLRLLAVERPLPARVRDTAQLLNDLNVNLASAAANLAATLNTGLSDEETRELMTTHDIRRAVQLVLKGLNKSIGLSLYLS